MERQVGGKVYCRDCRFFRPYRTTLGPDLGYCGVNARRHELDRNQRRRCPDYAAVSE